MAVHDTRRPAAPAPPAPQPPALQPLALVVVEAELTGTVKAGVEVAVLDGSGTIVAVNDSWLEFCLSNGGDPDRAGVGVSYIDICESAVDEPSRLIAVAIRSALAGQLPEPRTVEIACAGDGHPEQYDVLISGRSDAAGSAEGALISLSPTCHREASLHQQLTHELLAVGSGLQELLTMNTDPERAALDPTLAGDLREVIGRLWNALLGPGENINPR